MNRILLALITLPACMGGEREQTGQCPAGETCSTATPDGLDFIGTSLGGALDVGGPYATAIGGTQEIALDNDNFPLELAYTVDDEGGEGVRYEHQNGNLVTVQGAGSFSNYLRILDATTGELFDRKQVSGAQLSSIAVMPSLLEVVPTGMPVAFVSGHVELVVALEGAVQDESGPTTQRLIDTSMVATLAGSTQSAWDTLALPNAIAGDYPLGVTAGNMLAQALTVSVVDAPDAIAPVDASTTIAPDDEICFAATNNGRYVAGLVWSFTVDGAPSTGLGNCVGTDVESGTVKVTASAGGQTATVEMTVVQSAKRHARAMLPAAAGERAAM